MKKFFTTTLAGVALAATLAACGSSSSSSSTAASASSASAASSSAAAPAQSNIVQTAVATGKFKTLVSLVKQAGLAGALSGPGPLTVFAPTDAAFAKVPKATLAALAKDKAKLKAVLLYHVVSGRFTAAQVVKQKSLTTLEGGTLSIGTRKHKVYVNSSRVIKANV